MEEKIVKVKVKEIAQSAQKLRLVADTVRGLSASDALNTLEFLNKKGALTVRKALNSGIANARDLYGAEVEDLVVSKITVDEGTTLKRIRFASRGKIGKHYKRRAHLNLELKVK
jgi:large subunit ribosomal protein L22